MSNDFVPGNDLEEALVNAATNPSWRPDFYRRLVEADLLFLTSGSPETGGGSPEEIEFLSWQGPRGPFVPCFSSAERLQEISELPEETGSVVTLAGRVAFELLAERSCEAVLNPGLGYGKRFVQKEIRRLADGTIFEAVSRLSEEVPPVQAAEEPQAEEEPTQATPQPVTRSSVWPEPPPPAAWAREATPAAPAAWAPEPTPAPRWTADPTPLTPPSAPTPAPIPAASAAPARKPWWKFW